MTLSSILLIGGGNMGAALAARWKAAFAQASLTIVETNAERREALAAQGFTVRESIGPAMPYDVVVLAVKPQIFPSITNEVADVAGQATLVSIMAGVTLAALEKITAHAARVMPNTPAMIGEGMSAIYAPRLSDVRLEQIKALFGATGHVVLLPDEESLHAVTAISGSGPAYLFAFMEALERAAQTLGLDATTARALVMQTMRGAALLADRSGGDAGRLRVQVTSPGGTTEAALNIFTSGEFPALVEAAVRAAAERSKTLASA